MPYWGTHRTGTTITYDGWLTGNLDADRVRHSVAPAQTGWAARVTLGAHGPSDLALSYLIGLFGVALLIHFI
jgi:hypothetical protein